MSNLVKYISNLWRKEPYLRFIVLFILLYFLFYGFNTSYIGITAKGGFYIPFLDQHLNYINWWRTFTIKSTATILQWMDYNVYTHNFHLKVIGRHGFTLVYTCLGYGIMSVFAAFVLAFPGKIKSRYGFLVLGILVIQLLNTLRLMLLALYWDRKAPLLKIDHHDLFNIIVYAILILLVYIWLKRINKSTKV